jgi:hypothetical protein
MVLVRAQRDPLAPAERIHKVNGRLPFLCYDRAEKLLLLNIGSAHHVYFCPR